MRLSASIISVGTEITLGQITNRNCQWISQQLLRLGLATDYHLVVPDDRPLMIESMEIARKHSKFVFVTGGLGPTTDDFTREVVAQWAQQDLLYNPDTWNEIQAKLSSRGIPVRDMQKQQCWFPKDSKILKNPVGTAHGFFIDGDVKIFVLPGPPIEIEAIWNGEIKSLFESFDLQVDPLRVKIWDTLGLGESEVATLCQQALGDCPFEIGYRVHLPYVEVKMAYHQSQLAQAQPYLQALEKALGPIALSRDGSDISEVLIQQLGRFSEVTLDDQVSGTYLLGRCLPFFKNLKSAQNIRFQFLQNGMKSFDGGWDSRLNQGLSLVLSSQMGKGRAELIFQEHHFSKEISLPTGISSIPERQIQYMVEVAMAEWLEQIKKIPSIE